MNVIAFPARMSLAEELLRKCSFYTDYTTREQLGRAIAVFNKHYRNPWDSEAALMHAAQELKWRPQ